MAEYRIDDLAREAGTTTRNVRVYQENGLLSLFNGPATAEIYSIRYTRSLRAAPPI